MKKKIIDAENAKFVGWGLIISIVLYLSPMLILFGLPPASLYESMQTLGIIGFFVFGSWASALLLYKF